MARGRAGRRESEPGMQCSVSYRELTTQRCQLTVLYDPRHRASLAAGAVLRRHAALSSLVLSNVDG